MLVEDVAGVRRPPADAGETPDETLRREVEELARARRRALMVVILDLVAVAVLFAFHDPLSGRFLEPGATERGVFTLGVLLVTAHAGFRLAQYLQLRAVERLHHELAERES